MHVQSMSRGSRAASTSSGQGRDRQVLPLIHCQECGLQLIRIESKKIGTLGQIFYKCPNNVKDDPSSCPMFKSEAEYRSMLERGFGAEREHLMPYRMQDMEWSRQDLIQLKQCVLEMKQEIRDIGKRAFVVDKSCVLVACVACFLGVIVGMICSRN